jgi:stage III sporulation protein AE
MLVVLGMCVVPFLQLGVHYIAYRVTGALSATVGDSRLVELIEGIGSAFGLVLGMTGACAFLLLISMVAAISLVAG